MDPCLLGGEDFDLCRGVGFAELADRRGQQRHGGGGDGAEVDDPAALVLFAGELAQPPGGVDRAEHVGHQLAAGLADLRPRAAAVEDLDAKLALEVADALAQRRLREVQLLGGPAKGAELGDGGDVFELLDSHGGGRG